MKNTINSMLKLALVIVLFSSAALADGDMGNGGRTCTGTACPGFAAGSNSGAADSKAASTLYAFDEDKNSASGFVEECLTLIGLI